MTFEEWWLKTYVVRDDSSAYYSALKEGTRRAWEAALEGDRSQPPAARLKEFRATLKQLIVESLKINAKRLNLDYGEGIWLELETPLNFAESSLRAAAQGTQESGREKTFTGAQILEAFRPWALLLGKQENQIAELLDTAPAPLALDELRAALEALTNEVTGIFDNDYYLASLRTIIGNTNIACVLRRRDAAVAALAKLTAAQAGERGAKDGTK